NIAGEFISAFSATTVAEVEAPFAIAGTLKNFYLRTSGAQPGTGSLVFTIYKNGSSTALTFTISAGAAAGTFSDTSHTVSVSAGDRMAIQAVNNATSSSANIAGWSMEFDPT